MALPFEMKLKLNLSDLQRSWLILSCFIETKEVSQHLHNTFHWLNGEVSCAHKRISRFSLAGVLGFQGEQVDGGRVFICVHRGGTHALPWQLALNQVWHSHMSENNGILYVFEHVSFPQQLQMESDDWMSLTRETGLPKWELGDHEAIPKADLQSDGSRSHCHPTSTW